MANKYRGESEITLGGKTYTLRPTFEALVEFEDKAGCSAFEALRDMMTKQSAPVKRLAAAFWSGIKAAWPVDSGRPPNFQEIGTAIQRDGITKVVPFYLTYLTNALSSDEDLKRMREELENSDAGKGQDSASEPETV